MYRSQSKFSFLFCNRRIKFLLLRTSLTAVVIVVVVKLNEQILMTRDFRLRRLHNLHLNARYIAILLLFIYKIHPKCFIHFRLVFK